MVKRIFYFTIASLKMTFRNRFALFSSFLFPIAIMFAFSFYTQTSTPKLNIQILYNPTSKIFVEKLKNELQKTSNVSVLSINKKSSALKSLKNEKTDLIISIIPSKNKVIQPVYNRYIYQPAPISSLKVGASNYNVVFYLNHYSTNLFYEEIFVTNIEYNFLKNSISSLGIKSPFVFRQQFIKNSQTYSYLDFLIPGILALSLMQGIIFAVINIIVNYKDLGVLRRLAVTPLTKSDFLASLTLTRLIFGLIQVAILIFIASVFIKVIPQGGILGFLNLAIIVILGSLMFVTLSLLISSISNKTETVFPIANLITLPMLFLSGVFFSVQGLPVWLQNIVQFFPLTYLANSLRGVYEHGYSLFILRGDIIGMIIWVIILFALNVKFFKWE